MKDATMPKEVMETIAKELRDFDHECHPPKLVESEDEKGHPMQYWVEQEMENGFYYCDDHWSVEVLYKLYLDEDGSVFYSQPEIIATCMDGGYHLLDDESESGLYNAVCTALGHITNYTLVEAC